MTFEVIKQSVDEGLGLLLVLLSIVQIVQITRIQRKKKLCEVFLLSLSYADLFFACVSITISTLFLVGKLDWKSAELFSYHAYHFLITISGAHLVLVTCSRVWTLVSPVDHNTYVTRQRTYFILAACWMITIITVIGILLYYLLEHNTFFGMDSDSRYFDSAYFAWGVITMDAAFVCINSFVLYRALRNKFDEKTRVEFEIQSNISLVCILVIIFFVVFTVPYAVDLLANKQITGWTNEMVVVNSALRSIVYFLSRGWCEKKMKSQQMNAPLTACILARLMCLRSAVTAVK